MNICNISTSFVDYPDTVCTVLFCPDCNLRCPFCFNWKLFGEYAPSSLPFFYVQKILESRKNLVPHICISGGEPTLQEGLVEFVRDLRMKRYHVKLDTNGLNPTVLEELVPYLSYVSMDIKTSIDRYYELLGSKDLSENLEKKAKIPNLVRSSVRLLLENFVPYEFRTTVVPGFVDKKDILSIAREVKGCKKYTLQEFNPSLSYKMKDTKPYPRKVLEEYKEILTMHGVKQVNLFPKDQYL